MCWLVMTQAMTLTVGMCVRWLSGAGVDAMWIAVAGCLPGTSSATPWQSRHQNLAEAEGCLPLVSLICVDELLDLHRQWLQWRRMKG